MATPTRKTEAVRKEIERMFPGTFKSIVNDVCAECKGPAVEFRDVLSRKEFRISGLCQVCQDEIEIIIKRR